MSGTALLLVVAAAALHAGWNAAIKSADERLLTIIALSGWGSLFVTPALFFVPPPEATLWPLLAATTLVHWGYTISVAANYDRSDFSLAYPLMRGSAPFMVAIATTGLLGQTLSPAGWSGVLAICAGILLLALERGMQARMPSIVLALFTAALTATYTILDGQGVRSASSPVAFVLWLSWLIGAPLALAAAAVRGKTFVRVLRERGRTTALAGGASIASYGLALSAMAMAPIALVAALREVSIVFATMIAAFWFKERVGTVRLGAIACILAGAVTIKLA